jgi:pimeloyl-ACP methyl ester carboxylesterase
MFRDIYIGGAGDTLTRQVRNFADAQRSDYPDNDIRYFSYDDIGGINRAMNEPLRPGEPLNLIGHSWGGSAAIERAGLFGKIPVDNLITIDPVGYVDPDFKLDNVRNWINVMGDPSPETRNLSDTVASVGRWFGTTAPEILNQADVNLKSTRNHRDFLAMMREARAVNAILKSYGNMK